MNKKSIETIDRFIIDAIEYIRKKSKKRGDEPTIIDYVFSPPRWNPPWRGKGACRTKRFSP